MLDKDANARILDEVASFHLHEVLENTWMIYNIFMGEANILAQNILDMLGQIESEFESSNISLNQAVNTSLFKEVMGDLEDSKLVQVHSFISSITGRSLDLIPDKERIKASICGLNAVLFNLYRWYHYLRRKYQGEIDSSMVL